MRPDEINKILQEIDAQMASRPGAKLAFDQMQSSNKREYVKYIAEAKQPEVRQRRIEKSLGMLETWWTVKQIKKASE